MRNCHPCRRANASRLKLQGTLAPHAIPSHQWENIAVDFIVDLPASRSTLKPQGTYKNIMTVTDHLTKMVHFLPVEDMSAEQTAHLFHQRIFSIHGLPKKITSDRGTQFTSAFLRTLWTLLGIRHNASTAFHPQTNGGPERANQTIEKYIRTYCNYQQDDWVDWLPTAELALNNHVNATTGMTPFFADHGRHPRMDFWDSERARTLAKGSVPAVRQRLMDDATVFLKHMDEVLTQLQATSVLNQAKQQHQADAHRDVTIDYKPGALVWLDASNIRTERPAKKLDHKQLGPFKVLSPIGRRSYRLELPKSMRIHPVFHTSLLRPAANDPLPRQRAPPPPPIIVEREGVDGGSLEYEVDEVVDSRRLRNKLMYKVKWASGEITEEAWSNLLPGSEVAVANFHQRMPTKPGPPSSFKQQLMQLRMMGVGGDMNYVLADAMTEPNSIEQEAVKSSDTKLTQRTNFLEDTQLDEGRLDARASGLHDNHAEQGDLNANALANYNDDCVAVDAWIASVAGAPVLEGGSTVTK